MSIIYKRFQRSCDDLHVCIGLACNVALTPLPYAGSAVHERVSRADGKSTYAEEHSRELASHTTFVNCRQYIWKPIDFISLSFQRHAVAELVTLNINTNASIPNRQATEKLITFIVVRVAVYLLENAERCQWTVGDSGCML